MAPDPLAGFPVHAPPLARPVIFDQHWSSLAFVHWPVRPAAAAPFFPPGTRPDVFADGYTYVGLVPFAMRGAGLGSLPAVPYLGSFLETNIRLYSTDDAGRHGVLFRSLDASRLAMVPLARFVFGMPYFWARMSLRRDDDIVSYTSRRRPGRGPVSELSLRVGPEVNADPLEVWLTARWGAHTRVAGRTMWVPNHHDAWPVHEAEVVHLYDELLAASGLTPAGPPMRALWSPGVRTRFGRPTVVAA